MSRVIMATPVTAPPASRTGAVVSPTMTVLPSRRTRRASTPPTAPPATTSAITVTLDAPSASTTS